ATDVLVADADNATAERRGVRASKVHAVGTADDDDVVGVREQHLLWRNLQGRRQSVGEAYVSNRSRIRVGHHDLHEDQMIAVGIGDLGATRKAGDILLRDLQWQDRAGADADAVQRTA